MSNINEKVLLFDLDGTLVDTSSGIIDCHKYTLSYFDKNISSDFDFFSLIGGPLLTTYIKHFHFEEKLAVEAVKIYRERYAENGIFQAKIYPGIFNTLKELRNRGYSLGVATLKHYKLANTLLNNLGILGFFSSIKGMDDFDIYTKKDLIEQSVDFFKCTKSNVFLVGDSPHDAKGSFLAGINFIAVTYGFGYSKNDCISCPNLFSILQSPENLLDIFF